MVYLIVPPIIIIVGVGLLILLLARRARTTDFATTNENSTASTASQEDHIFAREGAVQRSVAQESATHDDSEKQTFFQRMNMPKDASILTMEDVNNAEEAKSIENIESTENVESAENLDMEDGNVVQNTKKRFFPQKRQKKVPEIQRTAVEQSTLSFIRRRMLMQEQRRNPAANQDVDIAQDHAQNRSPYNTKESALIDAVARDPNDIASYTQLGMYYMNKKSADDARQCFKQILKLQPRNRQAQAMMKRLAQN